MISCNICSKKDFDSKWYKKWCEEFNEKPRYHRKQWEHCIIAEILSERGLLKSGKKGLGFAVGEEPLPSLFAKWGVKVLATDIDPKSKTAKLWDNGQLLKNKNKLWKNIGSKKQFNELVSTSSVDMNNIPKELLKHKFDFNWSSCSFEHLGSIQKGIEFIIKQMDSVKEGGWSIHTTELNLSSNQSTLENENLVVYRLKDIYRMIDRLEAKGCIVEPLILTTGTSKIEKYVDLPPYVQSPHLRLLLANFVSTSIVLIIQKRATFNNSFRRIYRLFEYYYNLFVLKFYYYAFLRAPLKQRLANAK